MTNDAHTYALSSMLEWKYLLHVHQLFYIAKLAYLYSFHSYFWSSMKMIVSFYSAVV